MPKIQEHELDQVEAGSLYSRERTKWGQISLQQLELLLELREDGNITAAARKMSNANISSVLYHLRRLEELIGAPLFRRGQRNLVLTDAGVAVCEAAATTVEAISRARMIVSESIRGRVRELRVGIVQSLLVVFHDAFDMFREERPLVELEPLIYSRHKDMTEIFERDKVDFYVTTRYRSSPEMLDEPVGVEEMVVLCGPNDQMARVLTDVSSHLSQSTFFILGEGSDSRLAYQELSRRLGIMPKHAVTMYSASSIKKQVEGGLGITILPKSAASQELAEGTLRLASTRGVRLVRHVHAAHLRTHPLSDDGVAFLRCFANALNRYVHTA